MKVRLVRVRHARVQLRAVDEKKKKNVKKSCLQKVELQNSLLYCSSSLIEVPKDHLVERVQAVKLTLFPYVQRQQQHSIYGNRGQFF